MDDVIQAPGRVSCSVSASDAGINRRFFQAVDDLVSRGRLESLTAFGRDHGVSPGKLREMRTVFGPVPSATGWCRYRHVDPSLLGILVSRYGVSGSWLLAGVGSMYRAS